MSAPLPLGHVCSPANEEELYVGYLPKATRSLARWTAAVVAMLLVLAIGLALVILRAQRPFADARFEYGEPHRFFGVIEEEPFPALRLTRLPEPGKAAEERYLLVAPGKHGAASLVAGLDGRSVDLSAVRILRDGQTMLEVVPDTLHVRNDFVSPPAAIISLGRRTLAGEIVDSKCHLGVMKPGEGKTHRDCAVRCISGGVPPMLVARVDDGKMERVLLSDARDQPLGRELLGYVAEPVFVTGELVREGESLRMRVEPGGVRRP